jgi:hypothetical protein
MRPLRTLSAVTAAIALLAVAAAPSRAVFTTVVSQETPSCDVLMNLTLVDELGNMPPFPANEWIESNSFTLPLGTQSACPATDNPNIPNVVIEIRNRTNTPFTDLHYVADPAGPGTPGTTFSNEDGIINGGQAFAIDRIGVNRPLVFENINPNGVFQPGEWWQFIVDDYSNGAGLLPMAFLSIGVGNVSPGGPSSGSIIAIAVPEPSCLSFLGLLATCGLRRRR